MGIIIDLYKHPRIPINYTIRISWISYPAECFFFRGSHETSFQREERNFIGKPVAFDLQMGKDGRPRVRETQDAGKRTYHCHASPPR